MGRLEQLRRSMFAQSFAPAEWFDRDDDYPTPAEPMMWVYRQEGGRYTVGFYAPDKTWHSDSDWGTRDEAAARVSWLNGNGTARSGGR